MRLPSQYFASSNYPSFDPQGSPNADDAKREWLSGASHDHSYPVEARGKPPTKH